jgi:cell division protein FtsL
MQGKASRATVFDLGTELPPQHVSLEVDPARQREYGRWLLVGFVLLGALLFNVWQRSDPVGRTRQLQAIEKERMEAEAAGRKLQLEVATLSAPNVIDEIAVSRLHMVQPDDQVVLQRFVPAAPPPSSVVALRR